MRVPEFVKEVVWSCYPPRYRQLAEKEFKTSLKYLSKVLIVALLVSGVFFIPALFSLKGDIVEGLGNFASAQIAPLIAQNAPVSVPSKSPWIVVDLNSNLSLTKELFVVDSTTIQYRFITPKRIEQQALLQPMEHKARAAGFVVSMLLMLLPGIILLLYVRLWLKYLVMIFVFGTLFFIIMELTKFRLKWKQMLNVAAHALTFVIFVELIVAALFSKVLIPLNFRFLGLEVYAVSLGLFAVFMVAGVVGYHLEEHFHKK